MMDPAKQLKNLRSKSEPDKAYKKCLRAELCREFDILYPSLVMRWRNALVLPLAAVVIVATMGAGTYAYASPEVNQNHALFPVKQGIERVEMELNRSPEARAQFHARMMDRRLKEGEIMFHHDLLTPEQLEFVASELDLSVEQMVKCHKNMEERQDLMRQIGTQNRRYQFLIINVSDNGSVATNADSQFNDELSRIREHLDQANLSEEEKQMFRPIFENDYGQNATNQDELIEMELPDVEFVEM